MSGPDSKSGAKPDARPPIRREPTWRIPAGVLGLLAVLLGYGALVARFVAPWIAAWPPLGQVPVYVVLGVGWLWVMPVRPLLAWMETGRWTK